MPNEAHPSGLVGTGGEGLAERLYAAKPIVWRGQSELPQLPWEQPQQGLLLVIDLWSGIGGLLVALMALGIRCVAHVLPLLLVP